MSKLLVYFFILQLKIIDSILSIFKKKISNKVSLEIENRSYVYKKILNKSVKFFSPNHITDWRLNTLFSKEPNTINWIDNFKGDKIIFWDIGGNIGIYSIYAAIKHSKKIEIYTFEPSSNNLRVLCRNISINNFEEQIKIVQIPLYDGKPKILKMKESNFIEGSAINTFSKEFNHTGNRFNSNNSYHIVGSNIDFLLEQNIVKFPNYIKIDVDGLEHLIIKGFEEYLKKNNDQLKEFLIELNPEFIDQYEQTVSILKDNGFHMDNENNNRKSLTEYIFKKK